MAKKKRVVHNATRGYATVSIASKPREVAPNAPPRGATEAGTASTEDCAARAEGGVGQSVTRTSVDHGQNIETSLTSPEDLEQQLEQDAVQLLVEHRSASVHKNAARQISRANTESRILRGQAQSLQLLPWISAGKTEEIILAARDDLDHVPKESAGSDATTMSEDNLIACLWTLQETLIGLHFNPQDVDTALNHVLVRQANIKERKHIWGFDESLEYLSLLSDTTTLPSFEEERNTGKRIRAAPPDGAESTAFSYFCAANKQAEVVSAESSQVLSGPSSNPSPVTSDTQETTDISDLDSDMEPEVMLQKYVALKTRLFELESDHVHPRARDAIVPSGVAYDAARTSAATKKRKSKLMDQVAQLERDVLFDQGEAVASWSSKQKQLLSEAATRRRLGLFSSSVDSIPRTQSEAELSHTSKEQSQPSESPSFDDNILGAMFTEVGVNEELPSKNADTKEHVASVIQLRDFGKYAGVTPRKALETMTRSRDGSTKVTYRQVSPTVFSCRHSVVIHSSKLPEQDHSLPGFNITRQSQSLTITMATVSACNERQSEDYVSTAALFALFSTSPKDDKIYMQLAQVWREVWHDLAAHEKARFHAEDCQRVREIRARIRSHQSKDDEEAPLVGAMKRPVEANSTSMRFAPHPSLIASSEDLKRIWTEKSSSEAYRRMMTLRSSLPIASFRQKILSAIDANPVVILCGETGCGKSTQLPSFVLEDQLSRGRSCSIYCTEPRRISAVSLAQRVSAELGEPVGALGTRNSLIGFAIRLESRSTIATRLTYATVGIVLRMLESDPNLGGITHLIIDEVHERSIDTDFLLIIVRRVMAVRKDLKVILMSATVDAQKFSGYFNDAPVLTVPGRTFPVQTMFLEDALQLTQTFSIELDKTEGGDPFEDDATQHVDKASLAALSSSLKGYSQATVKLLTMEYDEYRIDYALITKLIHKIANDARYSNFSKAFLVFLPGISEIRELIGFINNDPAFGPEWLLYPLHSTISNDEQQEAFQVPPPGMKKIVIATNIAETGVTIPDITCVLDTGKHKEMRYDERRQVSRLLQTFIARSNAKQRRGRAGRVQEGLCFHLFTKYRHDTLLAENQTPELLRLSLQDLVMRVKICDLGDAESTLAQALDPPTSKNVQKAIASLVEVGAFTSGEDLTPLGRQIAKLPLDAVLGKLCLLGCIFKCVDAAVTIAAILSSKSPFHVPFGSRQKADTVRMAFKRGDSDLLTAYAAYSAWRKVCQTPGQSEFQFCRRNFLSLQNLAGIEDIKSQLINALVDARAVSLTAEEYAELKKCRHSTRQRYFVPQCQQHNSNHDNDNVVNSVIAWAFYPKILTQDGKGWRNIANNQSISIHPTSMNKGTSSARLLSYYAIMQANNKFYNAMSTGQVHEVPLLLLVGNLEFRLHAGVAVVDGNRLKYSFAEWQSMCAVRLLRERVQEAVALSLRSPGKSLGTRLEKWMTIFEDVLAGQKRK